MQLSCNNKRVGAMTDSTKYLKLQYYKVQIIGAAFEAEPSNQKD